MTAVTHAIGPEGSCQRYEGLSERLPGHGIPWVRALRERSADAFRAQGFPSRKVEAWHYTDLAAIAAVGFDEALSIVDGNPALPPALAAARIVFVDVPGASQSQVGFVHFGPLRNAPDYLPTSLAGTIFGGSFTSRVNMNLRENKGYSYGARGGFQYSRQYGAVTAGASVRADATYQSLIELHAELVALQSGKTPPSAAEVDREKAGTILGMPSRFASAGSSLGMFRSLVYFGLPLDY